MGCLAQIVNVIAPLSTNAEKTIRQTIYYPYAWALQYAHGRVLDLPVESETYPIRADGLRADFARDEQVPFLDVVATHNPQNGQVALFMLNRDTTGERDVTITWQSPTPSRVLACQTLTGTGSEGAQHVRATEQRGAGQTGRAAGGSVDDLPAAGRVLHGGPTRHQLGRTRHGIT